MKCLKKFFTAFVLVLLIIMLSVQGLNANAAYDDEKVTLNIVYAYDGIKIPNAKFDIYYVADIGGNGLFSLAGDFKNYPVDVNDAGKNYQALAQTLFGYAMLDNITPTENGQTNSDGELVFSSSNLKQGMYLVVSEEIIFENRKYTVAPYIVSLPNYDSETNSYIHSVTSYPKGECEEITTDTDTSTDSFVSRSVLKKWNYAGFESERPKSVEVNLLKDGALYDTVQLSEENNWYHIWNNLDENSDWTIAETPVDGYTVTVTNEGGTFIITNTKVDSDTDSSTDTDINTDTDTNTNTETDTGTDTDTDTTNGTNPSTPSTDSSTPTTSSNPSLPQTGTLWWIVPILLMIGFAFMLVGFALRRGVNDEE